MMVGLANKVEATLITKDVALWRTVYIVWITNISEEMTKQKKITPPRSEKISKLNEQDGQFEKLEEKRTKYKNRFKPLFGKDVNDPSERGHD